MRTCGSVGADAIRAQSVAVDSGRKDAKKTQGRRLIALLKRRGMTYRDMIDATESVSPWKRIRESLRADESIVKGRNRDGWTTWRVVIATRWTA